MQPTTDRPTFLVTGAAGSTGRRATRLLLERGYAVRAFVRVDDDRARALADAGAEVVVGDMFRLDDLSRALEGVCSAYFVYPIAPGLLEATAVFAQAGADTGVRAVVNMSQISARREAASNAAQQHWIGERLLDRAPFAVTHLRPTFFADNFLFSSRSIAQEGVFRYPFGDGRHAPIVAEDQAHVIAAVMADPEPHAGKTYPLHGPVEMNHDEIAESFSKVLGRTIAYEPIDIDRFAQFLTGAGYSAHLVQHLSSVSIDYRNGIFSGTNDVVRSVGKTIPTTIEEFIAAHRAVFTP
ncbi:NmrA family NAD(P)-binding protein [Nocardia sp. NEAU-G5]|uniref:NmrA family NAD(P)-binding protein n=1 Tax=Nocardia albiluteola TaxID=2842303 RepID=A0ABS6AX86_9NOCA|nr:NmrA family NAD(P)-binding protein [Nocardia albiluteola]MBU3062131.1 NmrA family NAD(P)-binding protein [Nocardia albiluteola]